MSHRQTTTSSSTTSSSSSSSSTRSRIRRRRHPTPPQHRPPPLETSFSSSTESPSLGGRKIGSTLDLTSDETETSATTSMNANVRVPRRPIGSNFSSIPPSISDSATGPGPRSSLLLSRSTRSPDSGNGSGSGDISKPTKKQRRQQRQRERRRARAVRTRGHDVETETSPDNVPSPSPALGLGLGPSPSSSSPLQLDYTDTALKLAISTLPHPAKLQFVHLMISSETDRNETLRNEIRSSSREIVNKISDGIDCLRESEKMMKKVKSGLYSVQLRSKETRALIHSYGLIRKIHTAHQNVEKIITSLRFFRDVGSEASRLMGILKREWLELEKVMKRMGETVRVPEALFPKRYRRNRRPRRRRRKKIIVKKRRRKKKRMNDRMSRAKRRNRSVTVGAKKKKRRYGDGMSSSEEEDDLPRKRRPERTTRTTTRAQHNDGLSDSDEDDTAAGRRRRRDAERKRRTRGDHLSSSDAASSDAAASSSSSWEEYEEEISVTESDSEIEEDDTLYDDGLSDTDDDEEDLGLIHVQHKLNQTRKLVWEAMAGLRSNLTYQGIILRALKPLRDVLDPFRELFSAYCVRLQKLAMDYPQMVGLVAKIVIVQERIDEEMVHIFSRAAAVDSDSDEEEEQEGEERQQQAKISRAEALKRARRRRQKRTARDKARMLDEKQYRMGLLKIVKDGIQNAIVDQFDEGRKRRLELLQSKQKEEEKRTLAATLRKERRAMGGPGFDSDSGSDFGSSSESSDEIILEEEEGHFDMETVLDNMEESISDLPHIKKLIAVHFPADYDIMEIFVLHYYLQTKQFVVENMGHKLDGRNCLRLISWLKKSVADLFSSYEADYDFVQIPALTQYAETLSREFIEERRSRLSGWTTHVVDCLFRKWDGDSVTQDEKSLCVYSRGPVDMFQFLSGSTQQVIGFELPDLLLKLLDVVHDVLQQYATSVLDQVEGPYKLSFEANPNRYVPVINDFSKLGMLLRVKKNEILRTSIFEDVISEPDLTWMTDTLPAAFLKNARKLVRLFRRVIARIAERASEDLFTDDWSEGTVTPMKDLIGEMHKVYTYVDCLETQFKETFEIAGVVLATYIGRLCQSERRPWRIEGEDDQDLERFGSDAALFLDAAEEDLGAVRSLGSVLPHITNIMATTSDQTLTKAIGSLQRYPDFPKELCVRLAEIGQRELNMKLPLIDQLFAQRSTRPSTAQKTFFSQILIERERPKGRLGRALRKGLHAVGGRKSIFRSTPGGPDSPSPKRGPTHHRKGLMGILARKRNRNEDSD